MGLKDEFDDAIKAVKEIDFTNTTRSDIPVFETIIRYLGGLVPARFGLMLESGCQL